MDPKRPSDSPAPDAALATNEPLVPTDRRDGEFTDLSKLDNTKDDMLAHTELSARIQIATNVNEAEAPSQAAAQPYSSPEMQQLE